MGTYGRFRPAGLVVAVGTAVAMAATMAIAAQGGAAVTERSYSGHVPMECVLAPGILNSKTAASAEVSFRGPETLTEGESGVEFTATRITVSSPPEGAEPLYNGGVRSERVRLKELYVTASGLEPTELNIATSAQFPEGPSAEVPVLLGSTTGLTFPQEGTFSFGPYRVTGTAGHTATLEISNRPGFEDNTEVGYKKLPGAVSFTLEGLDESGTRIVGPLTVACTPTSAAVLAEMPIGKSTATTITCTNTTRTPSLITVEPNHGPAGGGTTVNLSGASIGEADEVFVGGTRVSFQELSGGGLRIVTPPGSGTASVSAFGPATPCPSEQYHGRGSFTYESAETAEYKDWALSGSITTRRLRQPVALPAGSAFNGSGEVNGETGVGAVTGRFAVPPFTASLKLFGVLPVTVGLTLNEEGTASGSVAKSESVPGEETLALPAKFKLGITSIGVLGLSIPTSCSGAEPLSLSLTDTLTREELLSTGWAFSGSATLPRMRCEGGFLGSAFGAVLSALVSGPENQYSLKVAPGP